MIVTHDIWMSVAYTVIANFRMRANTCYFRYNLFSPI